jgi:hypothetical protein
LGVSKSQAITNRQALPSTINASAKDASNQTERKLGHLVELKKKKKKKERRKGTMWRLRSL